MMRQGQVARQLDGLHTGFGRVIKGFDVLHKLSTTFPDDGEYVIELTMDVEGQTEVIPFPVIAGEPSATLSVLIAIGGGLIVFVIVAAVLWSEDAAARDVNTWLRQLSDSDRVPTGLQVIKSQRRMNDQGPVRILDPGLMSRFKR